MQSAKPYELHETLLNKLNEPVEYIDQNGIKHICVLSLYMFLFDVYIISRQNAD